jgi:hypothetical protein
VRIIFVGFFEASGIKQQLETQAKGVSKASKVPSGSNAVQMHEIQRFAQSVVIDP